MRYCEENAGNIKDFTLRKQLFFSKTKNDCSCITSNQNLLSQSFRWLKPSELSEVEFKLHVIFLPANEVQKLAVPFGHSQSLLLLPWDCIPVEFFKRGEAESTENRLFRFYGTVFFLSFFKHLPVYLLIQLFLLVQVFQGVQVVPSFPFR